MLNIRKATETDVPAMAEIYEKAKTRMHQGGNPTQWAEGTPNADTALRDIARGVSYVLTDETGKVRGTFAYIFGTEPTYNKIDGAWLDDEPYGCIHRIATDGTVRGAVKAAVEFALAQHPNLRVDTHRHNKPMRGALEKLGFKYCGLIYVDSALDPERVAYQKERA